MIDPSIIKALGEQVETSGVETVSKIKLEKLDNTIEPERSPMLPRNHGEWSGTPGESRFRPDPEYIPGDRNGTNPFHKSYSEIFEPYGVDGVQFDGCEPDFSPFAESSVQIEDFSIDRSYNFDQADELEAFNRGCSPEEVAEWRSENSYTWHERKDCKTMDLVPTEVHGNIAHSGGISEYKSHMAA